MPKRQDPATAAQVAASLRRPETDPPTRSDGRCWNCKGKRGPVAVEHDDPFCKSDCARRYYNAELTNTRETE